MLKGGYLKSLVIALGTLLIFTSCTSSSLKRSTSSVMATHYLVTVHGLGGKLNTFGFLGEGLEADLKTINPDYNFKALNYFYYKDREASIEKQFNAIEFSQGLGHFLDKNLKGKIKDGDKISFVVHSQGGLVTIIWYFNAMTKVPGWKSYFKYAQYVDTILTLGTPMWGSKLAFAAKSAFNKDLSDIAQARESSARNWVKNTVVWASRWLMDWAPTIIKKLNMSNSELESMNFGGELAHNFRRSTVKLLETGQSKNFPVRLINIAGIIPNSDLIRKKVERGGLNVIKGTPYAAFYDFISGKGRLNKAGAGFGGTYYESDGAVMVPSSRLDFYYYSEVGKTVEGDLVGHDKFKFTNIQTGAREKQGRVPFHIVNTVHASIVAERVYDMAALPKKCLPRIRKTYEAALNSPKSLNSEEKFSYKRAVFHFRRSLSKEDRTHLQTYNQLPFFDLINGKVYLEDGGEVLRGGVDREVQTSIIDGPALEESELLNIANKTEDYWRKIMNQQMCDHPTYPLIFDYLSGCNSSRQGTEVCQAVQRETFQGRVNYEDLEVNYKMNGFTVDINIKLPKDYVVPEELQITIPSHYRGDPEEYSYPMHFFENFDKYIHFTSPKASVYPQINYNDVTGEIVREGGRHDDYRVFVQRPRELFSKAGQLVSLKQPDGSYDRFLRFFFTGTVLVKDETNKEQINNFKDIMDNTNDSFELYMRVEIPGFKRRVFKAKIKPTFSTYIEYPAVK